MPFEARKDDVSPSGVKVARDFRDNLIIDRYDPVFADIWDSDARQLGNFADVRELQRQLRAKGVEFMSEADESTSGPASFMTADPDGNPILFDQHV